MLLSKLHESPFSLLVLLFPSISVLLSLCIPLFERSLSSFLSFLLLSLLLVLLLSQFSHSLMLFMLYLSEQLPLLVIQIICWLLCKNIRIRALAWRCMMVNRALSKSRHVSPMPKDPKISVLIPMAFTWLSLHPIRLFICNLHLFIHFLLSLIFIILLLRICNRCSDLEFAHSFMNLSL